MLRQIPAMGLFCLLSIFVFGQNLFPNPGFEVYTNCPNSLGDVDNHVVGWFRSNTASPDYGNCSFYGFSAVATVPNTGTGVIGHWGGANHGSCIGSSYSEVVEGVLVSPLVAGQTYSLSLNVQIDLGTASNNPNDCVNYGVYFFNSSSPPASNGLCAYSVTPQWEIPGSSVLRGTYSTFTGSFTATGNFDRVIIGPFDNANPMSSGCGAFGTNQEYFNLDDILLEASTVLDEADFGLEGKAFLEFNHLAWELSPTSNFSKVDLERSANGQQFRVVHETTPERGQQGFTFRDDSPLEGSNHYRLSATDINGERFTSKTMSLQHGFTAASTAGVLDYFYDRNSQSIRFSLDTGKGGNLKMDVLDVSGRLIDAVEWQSNGGEQTFEMPVLAYASGMYILRLQAKESGQVWQNKFMRR